MIKEIWKRLWCNHTSMTFIDWEIEEYEIRHRYIKSKRVTGKIYKCNICGKRITKPIKLI